MNLPNTEIRTPWYRQFWPWLIIALPGSTVVAGITMLFIANQHADDLVVDDYYKSGLAINRELSRRETARSLELEAELTVADRTIFIELAGDIQPSALRLRLSHPMESERDLVLALAPAGPGSYRSLLPVGVSGRWHWTIDAGDGSLWRLDGDQRF